MSLCLRRSVHAFRGWREVCSGRLRFVSPTRHSTSPTNYVVESKVRLHESLGSRNAIHSFVGSLTRNERRLLLEELDRVKGQDKDSCNPKSNDLDSDANAVTPNTRICLQLAVVNAVPFVGFGFLDNAIMIVAGESIELSLGSVFMLSTMAAAAMGNLISDLAGIGLASGVEGLASRVGLPNPVLSAEQLRLSTVRRVIYAGRAIGLAFGCILGMFPLLFYGYKRPAEESATS